MNSHAEVIPLSQNTITPMEMLNRAVSGGATIEVLERLMVLQERWEANVARQEFNEALAAAKAEIEPIVKNRVGHNNKKYADFAAVAEAIQPALARHHINYRFRTKQDDKQIFVTCILSHPAGHQEENTLGGPPDKTGSKNDIQAIGSSQQYLMRYSLLASLGLSTTEDDDGAAAGRGETVSAEQAKNLRDMIAAAQASEPKFLKWAKVEKIEDIAASFYDSCVEAIQNVSKAKPAP